MSKLLAEEKAQSVMVDLLIGFTLFLVVLAAGASIFNNQVSAVNEQQELLQQQKATDETLNQLVSSTGLTTSGGTNWETAIDATCSNIESAGVKFIGLALTDRIILQEKINKFVACAKNKYDETKGKLLVGYDFYFELISPTTGATMKGCPDASGDCYAGKTTAMLEEEGKKIDTAIKSRRIVAFYDSTLPTQKWVSAIAEISVFKTR